MPITAAIDEFYRELLKNCFAGRLTESDALVAMVLLHTHELRLRPEGLTPSNGTEVTIAPLTQRQAASIVADLWLELQRNHDERSESSYWYRQYNLRTPYEVVDDVPENLRTQLIALREAVARDPRVASIVKVD